MRQKITLNNVDGYLTKLPVHLWIGLSFSLILHWCQTWLNVFHLLIYFIVMSRKLSILTKNWPNKISAHLVAAVMLLLQIGNQTTTTGHRKQDEMHIVISTDTDQYQRICCNIELVLPAPSMFDGRQRLVRSEELQHCYFGAQLVVGTSDKIECEMQLVLLAVYLPAAASTSNWEGNVIKCFPFTSYLDNWTA